VTRAELENKMAVLLGGRAAEQIVFDEVSTGAADDLARVTDIAGAMVLRYGMSEALVAAERRRRLPTAPEKSLSERRSQWLPDPCPSSRGQLDCAVACDQRTFMWLQQLDGKPSEAAIRAAGSDHAVVSAIASGQRIRFDLGDDRRGRTLAVDVEPFAAPGHSICRDIVIG
jgi:hypothetical protein